MSDGSVLLIGSVNLPNVHEVMEACSRELGSCVHRLTDGEAGGWCNIPAEAIGRSKGFEKLPRPPGRHSDIPTPSRLMDGVSAADLVFEPTGYVEIATSSYAIFKELRAAGKIAPEVRFQQSLPTPLAACATGLLTSDILAVLPHFTRHVLSEVAQIVAAIPPEDLAIQWDLAAEVYAVLEKQEPVVAGLFSVDDLADQVAELCNSVSGDVECGIHMCYGQADAAEAAREAGAEAAPAHVPADCALMVGLANALFARLSRPLTWLHIPVPIRRDDPAYCAPLKDLRLPDATQLYLGVVHLKDGLEGAERRIAAAKTAVGRFGVATECGLRMIPSERIPEILDVHRQAAALAS